MTGGTVHLLLMVFLSTTLIAPGVLGESASYRNPATPPPGCSAGVLYVDCTPLAGYALGAAGSATVGRFGFSGPYWATYAYVFMEDATCASSCGPLIGPSFKVYSSSGQSVLCTAQCTVYVPPGGTVTVSIDPLDWSANEVRDYILADLARPVFWPTSGTMYVNFY